MRRIPCNPQRCARWSIAIRGFWLLVRLAPFALAFLGRRRSVLFGPFVRPSPAALERRAARLAATLANMGPVFVKLGQAFASRADIVPQPYLGALSRLVDRVPPLATGVAEGVIAAEFGSTVDQLFSRFDPNPAAAASFGQVHKATYQGKEVAVKVLRPGVERIVERDLRLATSLANILARVVHTHWAWALATAIRELKARIWDETDLRTEARNAQALARRFVHDERVVIPRIVPQMTRRRVLVLEYVHGTRIDQLHDRLQSGELQLERVVRTITDLYLQMLLCGTFHADPHPGNLLIDDRGRVVLLDFGMVVQIDQDLKLQLVRTMLAVSREDVEGVIEGLLELGVLEPDADRRVVRRAAVRLLSLARDVQEDSRDHGAALQELLATFYGVPLLLPSDLVYLLRAAILVDGIASHYETSFDSIGLARDALARGHRQLALVFLGDQVRPHPLDWVAEAVATTRSARGILRRLEAEQLRLRLHPDDLHALAATFGSHTRRTTMIALVMAVFLQTGIAWVALGRQALLQFGLLASAGALVLLVMIPTGRATERGDTRRAQDRG